MPLLLDRAHAGNGVSRVIIQTRDGLAAGDIIRECQGLPGQRFVTLSAQVAEIPDSCLERLASHPSVRAVSLDRSVRGALQTRTRTAVGATWVAEKLGLDGAGVGVAIVDSGVAATHDDLGNRVVHFADFVNRQTLAYDDYGHGTHVAGIIAGGGQDSGGARRGIAPGAHLIALKALNASGDGNVSQVIAAIDYAVRRQTAFNIRVINLSVAAGRVRVVPHRSADAGRTTCGGRRDRRDHRRGQPRPGRRRAHCSTAASPRPATRPGC